MKKVSVFSAIFTALLIYSSNFVVMKPVIEQTNPILVASLRTVIPSLIVPFMFLHKKPEKVTNKRDVMILIIGSLGNFTLFPLLSCYGLSLTSAARASLIFAFAPILTILLSCLILKDTINHRKSLGIIVAIVGVSVLMSSSIINLESGNWIGDMAVIVGTIGSSIYYIASAYLVKRIGSWSVITYNVLISGVLLSIVLISMWEELTLLTWEMWLDMIYVGIFGVFIANGLYTWSMGHVSMITLSVGQFLMPFFSVLMAMFFLGEKISLTDILGGAIILLGVYLAKYSTLKSSKYT